MLGSQDYYRTPRGSQDIPHPRTIPDIISRSLFIHLCAALAYALLLNTLKRTPRQQRRTQANVPGPQWTWVLCSVLLPELILVQTGLWVLYKVFPCATELMSTSSIPRSQRRGATKSNNPLSIGATLGQALVLVIPLFYAYRAYIQRLGMKYHEATYVANLGLDHRNGWAAISGLTSASAIFGMILISAMNTVFYRYIYDNKTITNVLQSDHVMAGNEEEDLGYHGRKNYSRKLNIVEREESSDLSPQTDNQGHASFGRTSGDSSRSNFVKLVSDLDVMLPLVLTVLIHQVLLAVTNRLPPLIGFFTTSWCFLAIPVLCISFFLLPLSQQQVLWRPRTLGKWNDVSLPLSVLLHNATSIASWLLVGSTIIVQGWCDIAELGNAGAGRMQAWNYRWRVKDRFSFGDSDRVYMG